MKNNGNDRAVEQYYLGLDVGTNSVGWAVTDPEYNILKFKGNAMWGVRLFDEAQDASERRSNRTMRRRLARQKQRSLLLQMLFAEEIAKVDSGFYARMQESALYPEDKTGSSFSVFADAGFDDKAYHKQYPTVYHLRRELMESDEAHDVRLVFLALHHIVKSRGHFLYETAENDGGFMSLETVFDELCEHTEREYEMPFAVKEKQLYLETLQRNDIGITAKKKALRALVRAEDSNDAAAINLAAVSDMLAGATVKFADLFGDDKLKHAEISSFCLKNDMDEQFDALSSILEDRTELLIRMKSVYDAARLAQVLGRHGSISEAKIALYEKNKADLALLKAYVRKAAPEKYRTVFSVKRNKLNNYAAYSGYRLEAGEYHCKQEDFCKYLKKELPLPDAADAEMLRIFREIQDCTFLTKLRNSDNGVIPYQLHKQELIAILNRASAYLPFLTERDADGFSTAEKIIKLFEFRVPYYVGPINPKSPHNWAIRFAGQENTPVRPWNFETVINTEASAGMFIENLIGRCSYTGEKVLPKESLLYSEYMLRNEMNPLRINGKPLPKNEQERLLQHFFYQARRKVTKKQIRNYLIAEGLITAADEISGIDDTVKTTLRSYHDFRDILERTKDTEMVENIIRSVVVFGEDKGMLRRWLKKNTHGLSEDDIKLICRLKYKDWGRLSEMLLTKLHPIDDNGEILQGKTLMGMLRETSATLIQLMHADNGAFLRAAQLHRDELLGNDQTLAEKLDALYIAPAVRRSIRQTLRIVDEIVDIRKAAPEKIFIEMARGDKLELKNKRTESRKEKLIALYKACKEESNILFEKLLNEDDNRLRSDKLYLYYLQLGKCMYSGEPIDPEALLRGEMFDIDHIFPRSRIKDNSLDNRVLVKNVLNRDKTNIYPISEDIRSNMTSTWTYMKKAGLISQKKYDRLIRNYPLTEKELSDFVARQLVETQQSTKALAQLLDNAYAAAGTRIVYSKASNVSDFRHQFDMLKCRDVNDLHHAKDAYLNIVVGNVYCTKFTDRFFANIHKENYSLSRVFEFNTPRAWNKDTSIAIVKRHMAKNNVLVTRMPYERNGKLFEVTIQSAGKRPLSKKQGLPTQKYGGYNSLTGSYFAVVEYTEKKKRIRALQPVYLYKAELYEKDPVAYCKEVFDLQDPKIIAPKIRIDALLDLDGSRLLVSGRTENRILCKHTYQLALAYADEVYLRNVGKYVERCNAKKTELPVTKHDGITAERNMELYDLFTAKCDAKVYAPLLGGIKNYLVAYRDKFSQMSMHTQGKLLLEILKAFRCNAQTPNFTELCGTGNVGAIKRNMNISKLKTAYLINQSVTGLYETKVDLLR